MNFKKRIIFITLCVFSLFIGGILYIIFRENTYIAKIFPWKDAILFLRTYFSFLECDFLKFYFPDFLWAFSLCSGLHSIFIPNTKVSKICSATVFLFGTLYEFLQLINIIGGTFDFFDILAYLLGSVVITLINLVGVKTDEKIN